VKSCFLLPAPAADYLTDIFHAHSRVRLSVALPLSVVFAAFMLENYYFGQAPLRDYGGLNPDAFNHRLANPHLIPVREKKHLIEGDAFPNFTGNLLYFYYMPGAGFILSSAGPEDGVHEFKSSWPVTKRLGGLRCA
jgi:hypothetical protein